MGVPVDFHLFLLQRDGSLPGDAAPVSPDSSGYVVVDEFDSWVIREIHPTGRGLYLGWEGDFYPLDMSQDLDGFVWPKGTGRRKKLFSNSRCTAGYLRLYRPNLAGVYHELKPTVYVSAGSLSEEEYVLLLDRLGELAVSDFGATQAPIAGSLPSPRADLGEWIGTPAVRRALAVLGLYQTFQQQWPFMLKMPACQAERVMARVRAETPLAHRSPQAVHQAVRHPGQTHLWLPAVCELFDTPENRFIVFALRTLAGQCQRLAQDLTQQAGRFRQGTSLPPHDAGARARQLWNQGRATASQAAEYLENIAERLSKARSWANQQLDTPLLAESKRRAAPPRQPSLRLTRSLGYGPVYAGYRRLFHADRLEFSLDSLRRGLIERTVMPTMQLYELWVFLETYAILVEQFGFRPSGAGPLAHLEWQAGRLKLKRKQTYVLELIPENDLSSGAYVVRLTYEPPVDRPACSTHKKCYLGTKCKSLPCYQDFSKLYPYGPDIVIETEGNGAVCTFALDAKYRRYASQPLSKADAEKCQVSTTFEADVLCTAKQKYLDGMDYDAAFVVHSDPQSEYTYFGERKFPVTPHRERLAGLRAYADHRYGAIYAVPLKTRNLERLLKCLLMYHAGWCDICWSCRRRLLPGTEEQWAPEGKVSKYYQCKNGHGFWAVSHCRAGHTLIKLGEDSFHKIEPDDVWNCTCPKCGDRLGSKQEITRIVFVEPPPL